MTADVQPKNDDKKPLNKKLSYYEKKALKQAERLTFRSFVIAWAQSQSRPWKIPDFHYEIIDFLDGHDSWVNRQAVLQVFRGASKSTLVGLFIVYMLVKDPTLRFLILSCDANTAGKMHSAVMGIIDKHPITRNYDARDETPKFHCPLRPKSGQGDWTRGEISVIGYTDDRNPSCKAIGIGSNITGARADWIIFDDVEVPLNSDTTEARENIRARISESGELLVPNNPDTDPHSGYQLFVGTPHTTDSIYPEIIQQGCTSIFIPLLTDTKGSWPTMTGTCRWPERFNEAEVLLRQTKSRTQAKFLANYQLQPYGTAEDAIFQVGQINVYNEKLDYHEANGDAVLFLGNTRMVSSTAYWDPAMAKQGRDHSVLAIVFSDARGHYYIHRTLQITGEGDADAQCLQVLAACKEFFISMVVVESNGLGSFLEIQLKKTVGKYNIGVRSYNQRKNKATRIAEAFEAPLATGYIHASAETMATLFKDQLANFNPRKVSSNRKDDFIDAAASAILVEPVRVGAVVGDKVVGVGPLLSHGNWNPTSQVTWNVKAKEPVF